MENTVLALGLVVVAFTISLVSLYVMSLFERRRSKTLRHEANSELGSIVFLFDNETSVDSTSNAEQLMASAPRQRNKSDWGHFAALLQPRFPNLTEQIGELAELGQMTIVSSDGSNRIEAEWLNGLARIELIDTESASDATMPDRLSLAAMQHELDTLRSTAEHVPHLIWRENDQHAITWANRAYIDTAALLTPDVDIAPWPPQRLFERAHLNEVRDGQDDQSPLRMAIDLPNRSERSWFEIHETILGNESLFTATPVDKLVHAENSLSEFVTTLTKTFAHLPIGLAIFDRKRQLALFNPALTDLLTLPIEFLVGKPKLFSFLDQLREKRMMPEPRDYMSWRQQMADLEAAAVNGTYEETWSLPTGQTYRVTGRPQPGGAVAFLFEDITAEISLTRRFRSELEMGQSALDSMPEAVAVFSAGGVLSMSNEAYDSLWGNDPSTTLGDVNLGDAVATWRRKAQDTQVWQQLKSFVAAHGERTEQHAQVPLKDGRTLECRFVPVIRGGTLVSFRPSQTKQDPAKLETPVPLEA
ncbi:PAS-domain containing protein [Aliiroseovarius marinus]|uniref:PAS-domain containing protein n=1 Tax=Aliiroseovarius marinus TaxID=2500159 RepID=UPI003D7D00E4